MPGMKQKVTEMVFGREVSDRGETDGRGKITLFLCHSYVSIAIFFMCFLDSFSTPSSALLLLTCLGSNI